MGELGGEVTAGPGHDPAAERGVLEGLRVVAKRQPLLLQLGLQHGAGGARLDAGRARGAIHLAHAVQSLQVQGDGGRVVVPDPRLDPADHARPAAEGDDRGACLGAPLQDRGHLVLAGGPGHHVGRVVEPAPERAHDVAVGAAV